ncbi:MAG: hypothetical protein JST58_16640 [Bacteroidetes bacterium]|nr:hypothetical protein [Bacteroidota bacterium]
MKKYIPLLSGFILMSLLVSLIEYISMKQTGGHLCYPIDDSFIHMAVAKNLALHGNWGINPSDWVSATSSPLFTVLLSILDKIFSVQVGLPLVLSGIGTVLLIFAMQEEMDNHSSLNTLNKTICIISTLIIGAIPALTILGMEHTLQIAFTLFFVHSFASFLSSHESKSIWSIAVWAALMTITRYENSFLVMAAFALLASQKKYKEAFIIAAAGILPIALFGFYSLMHGGLFIPNSVLLKGGQNLRTVLPFDTAIFERTRTISGLLLIAIMIVFKKSQLQKKDRDFWILTMLVITGILHGIFGLFGWFYRYEAYLIVLGSFHLLKIGLSYLQQNGIIAVRKNLVWFGLASLLVFNLPIRGMESIPNSILAMHNIYEQQYQMGLFIQKFYKCNTVTVNDIGAVSYLGDSNILDIWGIGTTEVTLAKKQGKGSNDFLYGLMKEKNTKIAVIYDIWYTKELRDKLYKVASWEIPNNYICAYPKVNFYGFSANDATILKNNLISFQSQLPKEIKVEYLR